MLDAPGEQDLVEMTSEAMYDRRLSTRNTIALMPGSSRAFLIASAS